MEERARELDTVEFLRDVDGWPPGTTGAVVGEDLETALVEVVTEYLVDDEGLPVRDLLEDLVDVPYGDLRVLVAHSPRPV
jgi:hypothetical protein